MDNRFSDILANFKAVQANNEQQAKVDKYRDWNWLTVGPSKVLTNCLRSPDGRKIRHGHNGKSCNCDINFSFLIGDGAFHGIGHIFITK